MHAGKPPKDGFWKHVFEPNQPWIPEWPMARGTKDGLARFGTSESGGNRCECAWGIDNVAIQGS